MTDPRGQSPLVLANYPYRDKFTTEQVREALSRKDKLVELLMDPVGPDGCLMNLPVDMMHILAFHLAYAGADVHTDGRQLIEARIVRNEDAMFELYEWRPRGEFGDGQVTDDVDATGEAAVIAAQMRTQLTPEVRSALAAILLDDYAGAAPESRRDRATAVLTENRQMRGNP
jgi:hypothetical protein